MTALKSSQDSKLRSKVSIHIPKQEKEPWKSRHIGIRSSWHKDDSIQKTYGYIYEKARNCISAMRHGACHICKAKAKRESNALKAKAPRGGMSGPSRKNGSSIRLKSDLIVLPVRISPREYAGNNRHNAEGLLPQLSSHTAMASVWERHENVFPQIDLQPEPWPHELQQLFLMASLIDCGHFVRLALTLGLLGSPSFLQSGA